MEQFNLAVESIPPALRIPVKPPLVGIRGWLLVFCATNVAASCLVGYAIVKSHNTHDRLVDSLIVATTLLMLVLLIKRSQLAVLASQIAICTRILVNADNVRIAWGLYQRHPNLQHVATTLATRQIAPALTAVAWLIYFARSRRVHETFPQQDTDSNASAAAQS